MEKWKQKYLDSLEQLDQQEQELKEVEELLRLSIGRISLAADGIDRQLDKQLDKLRSLVRKRVDHVKVHGLINEISGSIKVLDQAKDSGELAYLPAHKTLARLIDKVNLPKPQSKRARVLQKKLNTKHTPDGLDDLLQQLGQLLTDASQAEQQDKNDSDNKKASISVDDSKQDREPPTLTNEAKLSAVKPRATPQLVAIEAPAAYRILLQLLDRLSIPDVLSPIARNIRKRLREGMNAKDYTEIIGAIADLVAQLRLGVETEKNELEDFLLQLTQRLNDIDQTLQGVEQEDQKSYAAGRKLDAAVRSNVRDIESSIHLASDLQNVKLTIQQRLDTINEHLSGFRDASARHQSHLQQQLSHLKSRLSEMEQHTSQLQQRLQQEQRQAMVDSLTGIPNRQAYEERLREEASRWERYHTPLTLMIMDIDHFKQINDSYGHKAGDKALKLIAQTLRRHLRQSDFIGRFGGEEFVALIPNTDIDAAMAIAEKLRQAVSATQFHHRSKRVSITISCGIAGFRQGDDCDSVFQRADEFLYQAKELGRNQVVNGNSQS